MLSAGFSRELLIGPVRDGLAAAMPERVRDGARMIEVLRLRRSAAGRRPGDSAALQALVRDSQHAAGPRLLGTTDNRLIPSGRNPL